MSLPDLAAGFQRDGHILLPGVASAEEVAAYRGVILAAREKFGAERTPLESRDTYLWPKDEGVGGFVLARRFGKIGADLLGVEGVRVYHDQAPLKARVQRPVVLVLVPRRGCRWWMRPQRSVTTRSGSSRSTSEAAAKAGDATFHFGWTLHGAGANETDRAREVMTVIWFADGARVTQPDNASRERDLERWLPGLKPGDLAATELNPLVFLRRL